MGILSFILGEHGFILISGNDAIDTILFLIISFAVGIFVHQLSNHIVEPLIKRIFWKGKFYSNIYLIKQYGLCRDPLRTQILDVAQTRFGFDKNSLNCLEIPTINQSGQLDPSDVSHQIYRRFDQFTLDNGLAKKAHTANTLYSLYRTMTLATFMLGMVFLISYFTHITGLNFVVILLSALFSFLATVLFLYRTKNEGQRYIQGILLAVVKDSKVAQRISNGD